MGRVTDLSCKPTLRDDLVVLRPADDRVVRVVVERSSDRVVGEAVLLDHGRANRSCGFRIWISGARDRGLGTAATRLAVGHAFDGVGLHRVQLEVYAFNPRARRVYEKVGFVLEGHPARGAALRRRVGGPALMGMLEQDWRASAAG